jgi:hypothetical protein
LFVFLAIVYNTDIIQKLLAQKGIFRKDIDRVVSAAVAQTAVAFGVAILIDFIFRFLVIHSLYLKYKEEAKPTQTA